MKPLALASLLLTLTACEGYRTPTLSSNPSAMSADTLCFRHASTPQNKALSTEIRKRNLDCEQHLQSDPIYQTAPF